jgi:hypothetical protein
MFKRMTLAVVAVVTVATAMLPAHASAQSPRVQPDALRRHLFTIAHDSMGGRDTGSRGNYLTAEYVAAAFRAAGLEPAGENGTYFQTVPFIHIYPDPASRVVAGARALKLGVDYLIANNTADAVVDNLVPVFGGVVSDTTTWITAEQAAGKLVVLMAPPDATGRNVTAGFNTMARSARFQNAAGYGVIGLDLVATDTRAQRLQGRFMATASPAAAIAAPPSNAPAKPGLLITASAARAIFGSDPKQLKSGATGPALKGGVKMIREELPYAARNVVAVLRGSDPARSNTYMTLTAHNDHVGTAFTGADHDSIYAYNRVIRTLGADTPDRTPSAAEWQRINAIRDSLKKSNPGAKRDSIFNGADDDGTGTVALIEVARNLAAGPRPARSILFVNHVAEERGLVGSRWFTDHPTVERDSIIGEMDMDMVGRGNAWDNAAGGIGYLEVVGAKRLSNEYGGILEQVNARQPIPFAFNYEFDAPGHPLQYYCRADHYSYARWSIPAFAVSRGEHADYHQVTDEAQYIDYTVLSRVANLAMDFGRTIANLDHRPALDKPKADPNTPCRQ